jgi:hypothetical protein
VIDYNLYYDCYIQIYGHQYRQNRVHNDNDISFDDEGVVNLILIVFVVDVDDYDGYDDVEFQELGDDGDDFYYDAFRFIFI